MGEINILVPIVAGLTGISIETELHGRNMRKYICFCMIMCLCTAECLCMRDLLQKFMASVHIFAHTYMYYLTWQLATNIIDSYQSVAMYEPIVFCDSKREREKEN